MKGERVVIKLFLSIFSFSISKLDLDLAKSWVDSCCKLKEFTGVDDTLTNYNGWTVRT